VELQAALKLLENLTLMDPPNQIYLVSSSSCALLTSSLLHLITCFKESIKTLKNPGYSVLMNSLLGCIKLLVNLSNENAEECEVIGQIDGLRIILALVQQLSEIERKTFQDTPELFDILLTSIGLLINLVEKSPTNCSRVALLDVKCQDNLQTNRPAIKLLVELFENNFQHTEGNVDPQQLKPVESDPSEIITNVDGNVTASYLALLLGCLTRDNESTKQQVLLFLQDHSFKSLICAISELIYFQLQCELLSHDVHASYLDVLQLLRTSEQELQQLQNSGQQPQDDNPK